MRNNDRRGILGRILGWVIPLVLSLLAIWLVLRNIELSQVVDNLSRIGFRTYLLASGAYFVSFFFRVFSWYILMGKKVSYRDTFFTMSAGYLLNNVFPFRLGEIGRAVLLDDPQGPSGLAVLSSVLVERIFDVFLAAVFLLTMLPRILNGTYDQSLIILAFSLTLLGMAVLFLVVRFRMRINYWLNRWGERADFVKKWIKPKVDQVLEGLSILNHPGSFLLAFGSLTLSWFVAFGENFIVFNRLYSAPPFWWMIFVLSAGAFGAALPSAPAGLGVFEGVMVAAFVLLGVDAELALTHAIVIHAIAFVYANILGLIGLKLRGEALLSLYRRVIRRSPEVQLGE